MLPTLMELMNQSNGRLYEKNFPCARDSECLVVLVPLKFVRGTSKAEARRPENRWSCRSRKMKTNSLSVFLLILGKRFRGSTAADARIGSRTDGFRMVPKYDFAL